MSEYSGQVILDTDNTTTPFPSVHSLNTGWTAISGALALGIILLLCAPLLICSPLWVDATHYDICARTMLSGGVHYRDTFDTNLPGMAWCHAAVRAAFGWRAEALRAADLGVLLGIVGISWVLMRRCGVRPAAAVWSLVAIVVFYVGLPQSCHCQRDFWMLLPCLAGLNLRLRSLDAFARGHAPAARLAIMEGALWGLGVWIKPHVLVVALATTLTGLYRGRLAGCRHVMLLQDMGRVACGGLLIGLAGVGIMMSSGSWPWFQEIVFGWAGHYFGSADSLRLERWTMLGIVLFPWSLLLGGALLAAVRGALTGTGAGASPQSVSQALVGGFVLGWVLQALLQHPHDYVVASAVVPAILLLAVYGWPRSEHRVLQAAMLMTLAVVFVRGPLVQQERLRLWLTCWREGSTPRIRDQLSSLTQAACWQELAEADAFLRSQGVRDGELTCWDSSSTPLYRSLDVRPSSRFLHAGWWIRTLPQRRSDILREVMQSDQRFVVTDVGGLGVTREEFGTGAPRDAIARLERAGAQVPDSFPWTEPVAFCAGRFLIHRVEPQPVASGQEERAFLPADTSGASRISVASVHPSSPRSLP